MLLIGWDEKNWIVKDSWPCKASNNTKIPFNGSYPNIQGIPSNMFSEAYIIERIIKENYNEDTQTWSVEPKIAKKINNCYNQGEYELIGIDKLIGAKVTGWSYTTSGSYIGNINLTPSADKTKCTVSGNGEGVTLYATIQRASGIMEKVPFNIGTVGVPFKLITINGHCAGSNYEIKSKIEHPFISNCTLQNVSYSYDYDFPTSSDGSYYAIRSGQYAYWVFKTPNVVRYSATITASQTGCSSISNTYSAIMYSTWCGTSYKSAVDDEASDSIQILNDFTAFDKENLDENSPLVTPNPVTNDLTLTHIGEGMNDIRIYDLTGSLVYTIKTEETVTINVNMRPRGIYIVRYFTEGAISQIKPIKIVLE
jgi:hypothetical protein